MKKTAATPAATQRPRAAPQSGLPGQVVLMLQLLASQATTVED